MKQHIKAPDPWAAITGALLAISGVFELEKKLGITASELAIVIGSMITIGASARHWLTLRNASARTLAPPKTETLSDDPEASDDSPA
jgi:hypothetical protein